jgi:hypothetical protein|uniref:Uncharacterized protein n=1 Tax=Picea glauca TaxID=3330 RepID=A0A101LUD0_PICGL|nr:hypothetical protein ABT39_MTgene2622 [Picea glauca]
MLFCFLKLLRSPSLVSRKSPSDIAGVPVLKGSPVPQNLSFDREVFLSFPPFQSKSSGL